VTQAQRRPGSAARWIGLGLAAALGLGLWLWQRGGSPGPAPPPAAETGALPEPVVATPGRVTSLDSGGTLVVPAGALPASAPLTIELRFPEPSADAAPRPARVRAQDGRMLELEAPLADAERRSVVVEIPTDWLFPGRYVIEIETTEQSHFPLCRYALEVE
jgi:hypothetical protein